MRVFLSGGTHGDWQDKVIAECPSAQYWDPRTLTDEDMTAIATTERRWLDECDLLFVFLERDNPSGLGSAFEMGYAIAQSKLVLFVDEQQTRHTEWLGVHCLKTATSFQEGISLLRDALSTQAGKGSPKRRRVRRDPEPESIRSSLSDGDLSVLDRRLDERTMAAVGQLVAEDRSVYEQILLGTASRANRDFDWNVGYLVPHLRAEWVAQVLVKNGPVLYSSEGIAWGLGELASHDERIVTFLYDQCEAMKNDDAWWCAAAALEKIEGIDQVDLLKRTMSDPQWVDVGSCLSNIARRAAVIGLLKLVTNENLEHAIIPGLVAALASEDHRVVQNALWLLERLRFSGSGVLDRLMELHSEAEDAGHSIQPRVTEALGAIGDPRCRTLLEDAVGSARYFRTRAYAARGLGLIGDRSSLDMLETALKNETDERVVPYITDAIYSIRDGEKRRLNTLVRTAQWPENGMIADHTNAWYANPEVYETFSRAEDPEGIAFNRAVTLLPKDCRRVLDVGAGTGRFSFYLARRLVDASVEAVDLQPEMVRWLEKRIADEALDGSVVACCSDISSLPYDDSTFDAVVSSWGFPGRMWSPEVCLAQVREVQRVLRPGGRLITLGWDESFQDELSEMWYRYVPEPEFYRESVEDWRRRRVGRVHSPRNCYLTFAQRQIRVPLRFESVEEASYVMGHLFGFSAGKTVAREGRREFSMNVGITCDTAGDLASAAAKLELRAAAV